MPVFSFLLFFYTSCVSLSCFHSFGPLCYYSLLSIYFQSLHLYEKKEKQIEKLKIKLLLLTMFSAYSSLQLLFLQYAYTYTSLNTFTFCISTFVLHSIRTHFYSSFNIMLSLHVVIFLVSTFSSQYVYQYRMLFVCEI